MVNILSRIPLYKSFRTFGRPLLFPINVTVSVTYRCNARCKTCNVWQKKADEFTLEEFDKTFRSLGKVPYWFTISGGEPFLRKDIVEICQSVYENCHPGIINIPTNGILYKIIPERVEKIVKSCPDTHIVINFSLDEIAEKHDEIRGVKDNFRYATEAYRKVKALNCPNLTVGIHTVISKFNVDNMPNIHRYYMENLCPDSYITEIAEQRKELGTLGSDITPSLEKYTEAINYLIKDIQKRSFSGLARITQPFRLQYYDMVKKILAKKEQIIPCYAGFASAHIAPDGDVWFCCIKAEPVGNLREVNYNFGKVWRGKKADNLRKRIKNRECYCPMANVSYTNMLMNFKSLIRVAWRMFFCNL